MWGISPLDQLYCRIQFRQSHYEGPYTPFSLTPSIQYPGSNGAMNWGGVSVDPAHGVMIVNPVYIATRMQLLTRQEAQKRGARPMGPWGNQREMIGNVSMIGTPYGASRPFWLTPLGVPCNAPPYGHLSAVDLNSGRLLWTQPFGTARGSGPAGIGLPFAIPMGAPNYGGSMITRSGLVFIGASKDGYFRAYELRSGKLLWRADLPGGGSSTPVSYTVNGRQYVVIAAAGSFALQSPLSTKLLAFALPKR
jgi:quinoprotein glucose dehydrogenase